jgi:hypothetical protein
MERLSKLEKRYRGLHYEAGQLPAPLIDRHIFWQLPHETRRFIYRVLVSGSREHFRRVRHALPENANAPTLKPFLDTKSVFVHIPKAAGVSISFSLYGRKTGDHRTMADYALALSRQELKGSFKFTFVRNPWDRLLSAYFYLKQGGRNKQYKRWAQENLSEFNSFEDFVKRWLTRQNVNSELHFKPQYKFLCISNSEPCVDYIGYFENLKQAYNEIKSILGTGKELAKTNTALDNSEYDYRDYYTHKSKEIVRESYHEDIAILGDDFD